MQLRVTLFTLFFTFLSFSQELKFVSNFLLDADEFIGVDNFENYYYVKGNTFYKKIPHNTYAYANTQLGKITSVDITNPLKILLFYKDFNTVLFVDSQLNKLSKSINFTTSFSKSIAFVSRSSNNNLWLYSFDDNILQGWNHQTQTVQFSTQPLAQFIEGFVPFGHLSTYKNYWLVADTYILQFNEYGSFIKKNAVDNPKEIQLYKKGFIFLKKNKMYYQNELRTKELHLESNITIRKFSINANHIYIFDGSKIFIYKILKF